MILKVITLLLLVLPAAAQAHAFNVLIFGNDLAKTGAYSGFRLATRERDSHAGEESDGHLGGLDVYINMAMPGAVVPPDTDILVMLDAGNTPEITVQRTIGNIELRPSIAWAAIIALDFQQRYADTYGQPADPDARRGYYAAQLIERYVRGNAAFANRSSGAL